MDADDLVVWLDGDGGKAEVVADLRGAMDREISAVPTFVIDDRFMVPGAQDVDVFVNVLERVLAK
jgi:predicted DsbA family dithiol-disulfide isomerase